MRKSLQLPFYPSYIHELEKAIGTDCRKVLDVGCGTNSPLKYLSRKFYSVGVDAYLPCIKRSKELGIHDEYFNITFAELDSFEDGSFDCVVALDVIEHLKKSEGLYLLKNIERISRKKTIVFTPNGFVPQDSYDNNPWQVHKSGWTISEMCLRGYNVRGINGLKYLKGEKALIKKRPRMLWEVISNLSQYFVVERPDYAFSLLCVKNKM